MSSREDNRNSGAWYELATEEQAKAVLKRDYNYWHLNRGGWVGSGIYYLFGYSVPCPRGCCTDAVVEIQPAAERIEEIKEQMRELANTLRDARERVNAASPRREVDLDGLVTTLQKENEG